MKRVVGIGACVLDTVVCCREFPREDGRPHKKGGGTGFYLLYPAFAQ